MPGHVNEYYQYGWSYCFSPESVLAQIVMASVWQIDGCISNFASCVRHMLFMSDKPGEKQVFPYILR